MLHIWETGGTGSRINIVKRHILKNWKARIEPLCYRKTRRYENLERRIFKGVGQFDIPQIQPVSYRGRYEWIGFNYAKSCKTGSMEKGVHFFLDDYQFKRLWPDIDRYIPLFHRFGYVMSPDFSTYTDYPVAIQIYNHYRKHWIGAYLQDEGIQVIPTISWGEAQSFEWCFDGEPVGGTVAISSVGCMNSRYKKQLFLMGYQEMMQRLKPEQILCYGEVPEECKGNILRIRTFQDKFKT